MFVGLTPCLGCLGRCEHHRHLFSVRKVHFTSQATPNVSLCKLSFAIRKGLYPIQKFPALLGHEASGTIVALPTDEAVLNHPIFKARGYKVGSRVALVRANSSLRREP